MKQRVGNKPVQCSLHPNNPLNHWCLEPLSHPDPTLSFIPHEILSTLPYSSHPFAHYMNPAFNPFLKIAESFQHLGAFFLNVALEVQVTQRGGHHSPLLKLRLGLVTSFQRGQYGRQVGENLHSEQIWQALPHPVIKVNIMLTVCTSDMMWWQLALCPQDLLSPKLLNPSLIMRKSPKWGTLHKKPD